MDIVYEQLQQEEARLSQQIAFLQAKKKSWPAGLLEISHSNGSVQYYYRDSIKNGCDAKKKYIKKKDVKMVKLLAQRDYEQKLLVLLEKRYRAVKRARAIYEYTSPQELACNLSNERKQLVQPLVLPDDQFVNNWQSEEYDAKPILDSAMEILTVRGERVRSKSEKIIADTLERRGIPYKYEHPLELSGGRIIYPDFTVLNIKRRKEYIWEHLGMLDNEAYAANSVNKINSYIKSGYFPGEDLILTVESSQTPLSTRIIEAIIENYLI